MVFQLRDIGVLAELAVRHGPGTVCLAGNSRDLIVAALIKELTHGVGATQEQQPQKRKRAETQVTSAVELLSPLAFTDFIPQVTKRLLSTVTKDTNRISNVSLTTLVAFLSRSPVALHVVIQDAELLRDDALEWLSGLGSLAASESTGRLYLWVVGENVDIWKRLRRPPRLFLIGAATPATLVEVLVQGSTAEEIRVREACLHYMLTKPTSHSCLFRDPLAALMTATKIVRGGSLPAKPNALQYSTAWKAFCDEQGEEVASAEAGSLQLHHLPASAKLLLVALFYCASTSSRGEPRKQRAPTARSERTISKIVQVSRLLGVYEMLVPMVKVNEAVIAGLPSSLALHHIPVFLSLGILSPVANNSSAYHCEIAFADASAIANELGIDVSALLPGR